MKSRISRPLSVGQKEGSDVRTLRRNRRKERLALPWRERRRRARRAANVNRLRWVDKSAYFLERAQEIGDWLRLFGHLKQDEPGVSAEIAGHVQAERARHDLMIDRASECIDRAIGWEKASPL